MCGVIYFVFRLSSHLSGRGGDLKPIMFYICAKKENCETVDSQLGQSGQKIMQLQIHQKYDKRLVVIKILCDRCEDKI